MGHVLLTGMSETGKSTVLMQLAERGHQTVDADDDGWSQELPTADGMSREQLWREDRMDALLADSPCGSLFVAGCASNQGRFYDRFDAVVLLTMPVDVLWSALRPATPTPSAKFRPSASGFCKTWQRWSHCCAQRQL